MLSAAIGYTSTCTRRTGRTHQGVYTSREDLCNVQILQSNVVCIGHDDFVFSDLSREGAGVAWFDLRVTQICRRFPRQFRVAYPYTGPSKWGLSTVVGTLVDEARSTSDGGQCQSEQRRSLRLVD